MKGSEFRGRGTNDQRSNIWGRWRMQHGLESFLVLCIIWLEGWWECKMATGVEVKGWRYGGVLHRVEHSLLAPWGWSWGEGWVWSPDRSIFTSPMGTAASGGNGIQSHRRITEESWGRNPGNHQLIKDAEKEKEERSQRGRRETWMVAPKPRDKEFEGRRTPMSTALNRYLQWGDQGGSVQEELHEPFSSSEGEFCLLLLTWFSDWCF